MMNLAKVFEVDDRQVLVMKAVNDRSDAIIAINFLCHRGIRIIEWGIGPKVSDGQRQIDARDEQFEEIVSEDTLPEWIRSHVAAVVAHLSDENASVKDMPQPTVY